MLARIPPTLRWPFRLKDLLREDVLPGTPTMMNYKVQADNDSLYNTPPCYGIYICGKVFKWLLKNGGLEAMKELNEKKAKILYDFLFIIHHGRRSGQNILPQKIFSDDNDLCARRSYILGGASLIFASVPMNLMKNRKAGYILTGQWAKKNDLCARRSYILLHARINHAVFGHIHRL